MSFFDILEALFIGPLKLVFEFIYNFAYRFVDHPGIAIIFLSLVMNILVLPLYRQADAMQEASRDVEKKLSRGVAHIKKTFSGDERMMILQTYYRQNHYKPTDALHGSVSLLLEIPFFMAAYQFLSHLEILNGTSLGPINDLSLPDGLITIGDISINLLPILMTAVNVISSALYLKGFPIKTKVQLYAMAGFFLVFLYTSPAGLVFYWTLNNVFSLVKTIFYKIKNPQKVLKILCAVIGTGIIVLSIISFKKLSTKTCICLTVIGLALLSPVFLPIARKWFDGKIKIFEPKPNRKFFIASAMYLTALVGLLIPTTFISASPQEYVDVTYFHNPLWYVVSAACLAAGTFLVWMSVFYWLAKPKGKVIFEAIVGIMCVAMTVNYMFFGTDLGNLSSTLQYDNGMSFSLKDLIINLLVITVIALVAILLIKKWKSAVTSVLLVAFLALCGMSAFHISTIWTSVSVIASEQDSSPDSPSFDISTDGKNVVVIMLDRAQGVYLPYILNEKPELKEKFAGFTYYSNTLSFGGKTNFGVPSLFGGYEYTPVEMNKRDNEMLVDKHNEALKVMPVLFAKNGYDVTICDPAYANYRWSPDLSIFDEYENIDAYITKGKFYDNEKELIQKQKETIILNNYRNFFCFSFMKTLPISIQTIIYDYGNYCKIAEPEVDTTSIQTTTSISTATGLLSSFMDSYNPMVNLPNITQIKKDTKNTFLFFSSELTHEAMLVKEPEYIPSPIVDNTQYDANNISRFNLNGQKLIVETPVQMGLYQANMVAMIQLGEWLDYLRDNGVYDNTKIIIVADHGHDTNHLQDLMVTDDYGNTHDIGLYFPLLMVKDFNSKEFKTSAEFMTNADVPTIATKDLIENPVNPFTNKPINSNEKTAHRQYVIISDDWNVGQNKGKTFRAAQWCSIENNIWNKENWEFYEPTTILKEHSAP